MSDNTMPERIAPMELIAHGDGWRNVEYIRADIARAQLDAANARIAELEAKQWDVIAQKFIDLDEHIMATAASVGCDSVASMAREITKARARIAELEDMMAVAYQRNDVRDADAFDGWTR